MKKMISCILALSMIVSTVFLGTGIVATAASGAQTPGQALTYVPYILSDYDCIASNYGSASMLKNISNTSLTTDGVYGSYALKIDGKSGSTVAYIKLGDKAGFLANGTSYTVGMKLKRIGKVNSFRFGASLNYRHNDSETYTTDMLSTEWTKYSFTVTPAVDGNFDPSKGWHHLRIVADIPEGSAVYIDDIEVYATDDTYKLNLFNTGCDAGPDRGSFDKLATAAVDETVAVGTKYTQGSYTSSVSWAPADLSLAADVGVKDSYALKINGTGAYAIAQLRFQSKAVLQNYTPYYIEFKVKKSGNVTRFRSGVTEQWTEHFGWKIESADAVNQYISEDEYTLYRVKYITDGKAQGDNASGDVWNYINFGMTAGVGSYVLVDDLKIYRCDDESQTDLYTRGSFDSTYISNPADNTADSSISYQPYGISAYNMGADDWTNTGAPAENTVISGLGEGVKGSYALKLIGNDDKECIALKVGYNSTDKLKSNTAYTVKLKARTADADSVFTCFAIGLQKRWGWSSHSTALSFADENGVSDVINTTWREFTGICTTGSGYEASYQYVYIEYELLADSILYIDDIEVYEQNRTDGINYFPQGTFEKQIQNYSVIAQPDEAPQFTAKYVDDWSGNNGVFAAQSVAIDKAVSGSHVLALGFDDAAVNGRAAYEMMCIRPGKSYHVSMSVMLVGNIDRASVTLSDGDYQETVLARYGSYYGSNDPVRYYYPNKWTTIEFDYTDGTTGTSPAWAILSFGLVAQANSGILIDSVRVTETAKFGSDAPNLFQDAGFEKEQLPSVTWNSTYYGNSLTDLSFMNNLPKTIGTFELGVRFDTDVFTDILSQNSGFEYLGAVVIETSNIDVARFEARSAIACGKEIWIAGNSLISGGSNTLRADWQKNLTEMMTWLQYEAGDGLQGVYFDEPHLQFESDAQFIEVTRFIRENFKKRVFSMTKHDMFNPEGAAAVHITAASHAYVTDIAYWDYSPVGVQERINGWVTATAGLDVNMRKWICTLYGSNSEITNEADVLQHFNDMLAGSKEIAGFGGIMLYSLGDTNGYELMKNDANGTAVYENYRTRIKAIAADFNNPFADFLKDYTINEDNVIVLAETGLTVDQLLAYTAYTDDIAVKFGNVQATGSETLKTGGTVLVKSISSGAVGEYEIAVHNDINGDGTMNVADLVRMKKIAAGLSEDSAASLAAVGSTLSRGITAEEFTAMRKDLLR